MTDTLSDSAIIYAPFHIPERLPAMGDSEYDECRAAVEDVRGHINKLDLWVAAHDARINAYWEAQHSWNIKTDDCATQTLVRISAIERKIMWWAGFAAAAGSVVGSLIGRFM